MNVMNVELHVDPFGWLIATADLGADLDSAELVLTEELFFDEDLEIYQKCKELIPQMLRVLTRLGLGGPVLFHYSEEDAEEAGQMRRAIDELGGGGEEGA